MRGDGVRGGRAVTGLLAGVPLRVRLVAAACCLAAAGAAIVSLACGLAVRSGLMWQAGQELRSYAGYLASRPFTAMPVGPGPGGDQADPFVIEVVTAGQLVIRTGVDPRPGPALAAIAVPAGQLATVRAGSGGGSWLVVTEAVHYSAKRILFTYGSDGFYLDVTSTARPGTAGTLVVGLDLSSVSQAIRNATASCAAVSAAAILAIAVLGLAVIRAILRPLAQLDKAAAGVVAHGVPRRLPGDRAGGLADGLTRSLATVCGQAGRARESADAARGSTEQLRGVLLGTCRELRRPVGVIGGFAEYYRHRGPPAVRELDRMMDRVAAEAERMAALVDTLAGASDGQGQDQRPCPPRSPSRLLKAQAQAGSQWG